MIALICLFGLSGIFSGLAMMAISPFGGFLMLLSSIASADDACRGAPELPAISFITFQSPNLAATSPAQAMLTIEGKLSLPSAHCEPWAHPRKMAAVVILHGSSGVDSRGDFYERALNAEGIATLQIDMWQAPANSRPAARQPMRPSSS